MILDPATHGRAAERRGGLVENPILDLAPVLEEELQHQALYIADPLGNIGVFRMNQYLHPAIRN